MTDRQVNSKVCVFQIQSTYTYEFTNLSLTKAQEHVNG